MNQLKMFYMNFSSNRSVFLLGMLVVAFSPQQSVAQSKKEQISILQLRIDSLNTVLLDITGQLDMTTQQLKERTAYASDIDTQLTKLKGNYSMIMDSLRNVEFRNTELAGALSLNSIGLQQLEDKNDKLNSRLIVLSDSLSIMNASLLNLSNDLAVIKSDRDQLRIDLDKQESVSANTTFSGEILWCNLSEVNGAYVIQKRNMDWDFPQTVTVKIDTKKITFNAFNDLRTYDYGMKALDGTIHIVFADVSEETGDYLGGGDISFTAEGIKLTVITGTEADIEQVYFKRSNK